MYKRKGSKGKIRMLKVSSNYEVMYNNIIKIFKTLKEAQRFIGKLSNNT